MPISATDERIAFGAEAPAVKNPAGASLVSKFLKLLCSVSFGVVLLILLGLASFFGMIIMQQNVDGFDNYFAALTPAQRLLYSNLGLFDIYHTWYYNGLLALLSINIILSSIDRFPKVWKYVTKPNVTVPVRWLQSQKQTAETTLDGSKEMAAERIADAFREAGWRRTATAEKGGKLFVMGESGLWNRFAFLAVHVGLLVVFLGGFLTSQIGSNGILPLAPGETSDLIYETVVNLDTTRQITMQLPFQVSCTDIQQKLIKKEESLSAGNTIDWITKFTITDETGTHEGFVQMNRPYDYRGYRFFQSSYTPIGRARSITIRANQSNGGTTELTIPRDGTETLPDGTKVRFMEFRGNFRIGAEDPNEDTSNYPNPGAVLQITQPGVGATPQTAYAFGPQMADIPAASKPVGGYTFQLADFEKVSQQHILSVQRDPGSTVVYVGFILLCITLVGVFFFSHRRVWAVIEDTGKGGLHILFAGNTNRNQTGFSEKFNAFTARFIGRK